LGGLSSVAVERFQLCLMHKFQLKKTQPISIENTLLLELMVMQQ
jgi:hypothetical protein